MKNLIKISLSFLLLIIPFYCMRAIKISYNDYQKMPRQETDNVKFKKYLLRWDMSNSSELYDYLVKETEEINQVPCKRLITPNSIGDLYGFIFGKEYKLNGLFYFLKAEYS